MLALLAVTVVVGVRVTAEGSTTASSQRGFPFGLVAVAQGAGAASLDQRTVQYDLVPQPESPELLPERGARAEVPVFTPLPTPVAPPPPPPPPAPKPVYVKAAPVVGTGQLLWPARGVITQYYSSYHKGLDIAAPTGSTVIASAAGVVTWSGWKSNGGGLVITIDHGNGIVTSYNHLGSLWVAKGTAVTAGQGIAAVGCTGVCTGPHVMLTVVVGGAIVNPLRYL